MEMMEETELQRINESINNEMKRATIEWQHEIRKVINHILPLSKEDNITHLEIVQDVVTKDWSIESSTGGNTNNTYRGMEYVDTLLNCATSSVVYRIVHGVNLILQVIGSEQKVYFEKKSKRWMVRISEMPDLETAEREEIEGVVKEITLGKKTGTRYDNIESSPPISGTKGKGGKEIEEDEEKGECKRKRSKRKRNGEEGHKVEIKGRERKDGEVATIEDADKNFGENGEVEILHDDDKLQSYILKIKEKVKKARGRQESGRQEDKFLFDCSGRPPFSTCKTQKKGRGGEDGEKGERKRKRSRRKQEGEARHQLDSKRRKRRDREVSKREENKEVQNEREQFFENDKPEALEDDEYLGLYIIRLKQNIMKQRQERRESWQGKQESDCHRRTQEDKSVSEAGHREGRERVGAGDGQKSTSFVTRRGRGAGQDREVQAGVEKVKHIMQKNLKCLVPLEKIELKDVFPEWKLDGGQRFTRTATVNDKNWISQSIFKLHHHTNYKFFTSEELLQNRNIMAELHKQGYNKLGLSDVAFGSLKEGQWLDAEILDKYTRFFFEKEVSQRGKHSRFFLFNTSVYECVNMALSDSPEVIPDWPVFYAQNSRIRKFSNLEFSNLKYLIFPVSNGMHFILLIFNILKWELLILDSQASPSYEFQRKAAFFLIMVIKNMLYMRAYGLLQESRPVSCFSPSGIPKQLESDGANCGVYIVMLLDAFIKGVDLGYEDWSEDNILDYRCKMAAELLKGRLYD